MLVQNLRLRFSATLHFLSANHFLTTSHALAKCLIRVKKAWLWLKVQQLC